MPDFQFSSYTIYFGLHLVQLIIDVQPFDKTIAFLLHIAVLQDRNLGVQGT